MATRDRSALLGALEQLRLRLLDLSGRNRLLNFRHTAGRSLQFSEGHPPAIYQRLVNGANRPSIGILGIPEPPRDAWTERNGRLVRPDSREWATEQGIPTSYDLPEVGCAPGGANVRALLYPDDLAKHCRKIEREAVLAIEETGANMLFLVLGFLDFPDQRNSDQIYSAPLISIPVAMMRRELGGNQVFFLQYTGDDVSENLSLREKLKNDHGMILPELDEEQIDIEFYFTTIRNIIAKRPGFVLRRRVSLCLLSFANMLLVRDLDPEKWPEVDERHTLLDHPIVREVFEGNPDNTDNGLSTAAEHPVEDDPGSRIPLVFDADSSQHSALVDVLALGKNLVIEGPPGTGKSQTITNLIAACLAEGKKVLFVAEKLAALEVVKIRLSLAGLDPFVLELHSNKTSKKRVLEELGARVKFNGKPPANLPGKLQQLDGHRSDLRAYKDLINSVTHNAFGRTLHQIMWRAERQRSALSVEERLLAQIAVPDATEISEIELNRRMDCLGHLGAQYVSIGGFDSNSMFWGFSPDHIVPGDEIRLQRIFQSSHTWTDAFVGDVERFGEVLGERVSGMTLNAAEAQLRGVTDLLAAANAEEPLHLIPRLFQGDNTGARSKRVLDAFRAEIERFHALASIAQRGLRAESSASEARLETLRQLDQIARLLGAAFSTAAGAIDLGRALQRECDRLGDALAVIREFCAQKNIPFDGSRSKLGQLAQLAQEIAKVPEELLHLQTPGLTRDGCQQAVESLADVQRQWAGLGRDLGATLYLDALPAQSDLRRAILVLRQGGAWYRLFQGQWRSAVAVHSMLQRMKTRLRAAERLEQLERVVEFLQLGERRRADPAWCLYLGIAAPPEALPLDGYLGLAAWNQSIIVLLDDLQASVFSPQELTPESGRALRREYTELASLVGRATSALQEIDKLLPKLAEIRGGLAVDRCLELVGSFVATLQLQAGWIETELPVGVDLSASIRACEAALERRRISDAVDADQDVRSLLGNDFAGVETNVGAVQAALTFGQSMDDYGLTAPVKARLRSGNPVEVGNLLGSALEHVVLGLRNVAGLEAELGAFGEFSLETWVGISPAGDLLQFAAALREGVRRAAEDTGLLIPWSLYVARRKEAEELGLGQFVMLEEAKRVPPMELATAYAYCTYATIVREAFRARPQLGRFSGLKHNQIRDEFRRLDREIIALRGKDIAANCALRANPPPGRNGARVDDRTEMVLLNLLLPQQRPRVTVRKMLARAGCAIQALKPCFMMGPQAVAQYLTPGATKFDLVLMDEASQLKPEEAIGAIARGGQLVVVGDPKQLPPTSFFSRMNPMAEDADQYATTDAESILDVCSAHFRPPRALRWHYRSQHHSLIAFSNKNFYRSNLIIFPSPYGQSSRLGIRATYLADAIYDNQTNVREATRVAEAAADHISRWPDESLGVVTLNIKQRDLIAELLDERLRSVAGADEYRERWTKEGQSLFVKNLENVQGDERDAIIISTTFGKPPGSKSVRQNFGPISRQSGWRRLNVLFTRARRSIAIYTSLRPEDIVIDGSTPEGTKTLRNYLEYARIGSLTIAEETEQDPESDFEVSVIDLLRARGYTVTPQLGVAGYRIDIAVKHPDAPGIYLAAIECDGASYHSALSVRDRDRIRQEILESLGWRGRIWRIWSTDWFRSPRQEAEKLMRFLEDIRKSWKPEHSAGASWIEEGKLVEFEEEPPSPEETLVIERRVVSRALLETDEDLEVSLGDLVRYADVAKPDDILSVRIVDKVTDMPNGLISHATPLAQALLGAAVGEDVLLHIAGGPRRLFRVLGIKRIAA
jgi:very-short-patch-repair endonuclease